MQKVYELLIADITKMTCNVVKVLHLPDQSGALSLVGALFLGGVVNEDMMHRQLHIGQIRWQSIPFFSTHKTDRVTGATCSWKINVNL